MNRGLARLILFVRRNFTAHGTSTADYRTLEGLKIRRGMKPETTGVHRNVDLFEFDEQQRGIDIRIVEISRQKAPTIRAADH